MENREMVLRQNVMWEQKAGLRLGFIKWKTSEGAHKLSRNLVWYNVEHLEGWESLASPKQSTIDTDPWWIWFRECQKILSLPWTLGLHKWLLLMIPLMTQNYCLPWGALCYPDPHFQKWHVNHPISEGPGIAPIRVGPPSKDMVLETLVLASQWLWDMVSRKNPMELQALLWQATQYIQSPPTQNLGS